MEQPKWPPLTPKKVHKYISPGQSNFSTDNPDQSDEIKQREHVPVWLKDKYGPINYHPKNPKNPDNAR
jgi:hypothetical protein